jgi:uncharacterized membrane protein YedE/YeeE
MLLIAQFLIGLLFGSGLVISGMSNPEKVLNFLDLAAIPSGGWDPSLALVMAGGVIVTYLGYKLVLQRERPLFDTQFHFSRARSIDAPIIIGPAIFGIGWGLAGFCPGPAFTAIGTGSTSAILFVVAMLAGMVAARLLALRQLGIVAPEAAK